MIYLENFHLSDSTLLYCPMVFDSYLCWPKTKAGEKVWQRCPEGVRGLDNESKFFFILMSINFLKLFKL